MKKKSCHLAPKVVIDLPFEGRKVKGSRKYRGRERVPKVGSRREETITEPINSRIGEFHTNFSIFRDQMYILGYQTPVFIPNLYNRVKFLDKNFISSVKSTNFSIFRDQMYILGYQTPFLSPFCKIGSNF